MKKKEERKQPKISKKKKEKKLHFCRVGDTCPACGRGDAIVNRGEMSTALGDGMAGMAHLKAEAFFPLRCRYCHARFKKAPVSVFLFRPLSVVIRILLGIRA